jgi:regulatory protein
LDDERFAESYVRAHIRDKRWGPVKLAHGLREHGMDAATIGRVVGGEADRVWQENLQTLIAQRPPAEDEADRARLLRWLLGKGYRTEQILQALDDAASRRTFAAHDHD